MYSSPKITAWIKKHKIEIAIFVLALAARGVFLTFDVRANNYNPDKMLGIVPMTLVQEQAHDANIGGDCYHEVSDDLLAGHGFSCELLPPYEGYQYGVPGYPLFLAVFKWLFGNYFAVMIVQALIASLLPVFAMKLIRQITNIRGAPLFVALLLALEPSLLLAAWSFSPEIIFMVFFFGFLHFFFKFMRDQSWISILWSGFFLGVSTLIKPTAEYVPIIVVLFLAWKAWRARTFFDSKSAPSNRQVFNRHFFYTLAGFLIIFMAVIAPWLIHNERNFGVLELSTQSERALYVALLPSIISLEKGISFDQAQAPLLTAHTNNFTFTNSVGTDAAVIREMLAAPKASLEMGALSAFTFFTHDGMLTVLENGGIMPAAGLGAPALVLLFHNPISFAKTILPYLMSPFVLVLIARIVYIILFAAFLWGLCVVYIRRFRKHPRSVTNQAVTHEDKLRRDNFDFMVILILYFMLTTMTNGLSVTYRFRMPVEWAIFAIAWIGFASLLKKRPARYAVAQ